MRRARCPGRIWDESASPSSHLGCPLILGRNFDLFDAAVAPPPALTCTCLCCFESVLYKNSWHASMLSTASTCAWCAGPPAAACPPQTAPAGPAALHAKWAWVQQVIMRVQPMPAAPGWSQLPPPPTAGVSRPPPSTSRLHQLPHAPQHATHHCAAARAAGSGRSQSACDPSWPSPPAAPPPLHPPHPRP